MAATVSELLLVLRAQNQASGIIRRFGNDLRSLNALQKQMVVGTKGMSAAQKSAVSTLQKQAVLERKRIARWDKAIVSARMFGHAGRIAQLGGLAAGAGMLVMAKAAADLETQTQLVGTQMGKVGISFQQSLKLGNEFRTGMLKIMPDSTSSTQELTAAGYDLFSSLDTAGKGFLTASDGLKLLKANSDAAIAGQTDVATATQGVIAVLNNFEKGAADINPILQRMFAAVRFGRITFSQFAATLATSAPAANQAGQSFDTLAGTMAFLTRSLGPNKAAVGFARLTEILTRKKFVDGLKEAGVEITGTNGRFLQLDQIIRKIVKRFPELKQKGTKQLAQFFKEVGGQEGTIQARRAFQALVTNFEGYQSVLGRVVKDNKEFTKSLRAMEQTTGVKWGKFVNQVKALALAFGADLIPVLTEMIEPLKRVIEWWKRLDDGTKKTIAKIALFTATFALLGGTIAAILGSLAVFVGMLGKLRILGGFLGISFLAIIAAVKALKGEFVSLGSVAEQAANMITSSWEGMAVAGFALLQLMRRINRTIIVTRASVALGETGGLAGMLVGGKRGIAGARAARAEMTTTARSAEAAAVRAARVSLRNQLLANAAMVGAGASTQKLAGIQNTARTSMAAIGKTAVKTSSSVRMLGGVGSAAAAGLGAIGPAGWAMVAGLAAAGGAMFLWKRHADSMAKKAEEVREALQHFQAPLRAVQPLGGLGKNIRELERAKITVRDISRQITQLQEALTKAPPRERAGIRDQIALLRLDLGDARDVMAAAQQDAVRSQTAITNSITTAMNLLSEQQLVIRQIAKYREELARLESLPAGRHDPEQILRMQKLKSNIQGLQGQLVQMNTELSKVGPALRRNFGQAVKDMGRGGLLGAKFKVDPKAVDRAFEFALKRGKMLTPKQLKLFFKIDADPGSIANTKSKLKKFAAEVQKFLVGKVQGTSGDKTNRAIQEKLSMKTGKPIDVSANTKPAQTELSKLYKTIAGANPLVKIGTLPASGFALGTQFIAGLNAGLQTMAPTATITIQRIYRDHVEGGIRDESGAHSPSRKMMAVGHDLMLGLVQGIMKDKDYVEQNAKLAMQFLTGAAQDKLEEDKKKITAASILTDAKTQLTQFKQFNAAMNSLLQKHVPKKLVEELSNLGIEGVKKIAVLNKMSAKELKQYVNIWRRSMKAAKDSAKFGFEGQAQAMQEAKDKFEEMKDSFASTARDLWEANRSAMGDLFTGGIIENVRQAADDWQSAFDDLASSIESAQDELKAAIQARKDELWNAFGELMSGPRTTALKEWGIVASMKDMVLDLKDQLTKFKAWRAALDALAKRGLPGGLLKQLEELGPDATGSLEQMVNASDADLKEYVNLWKQADKIISDVAVRTAEGVEQIVKEIQRLREEMAKLGAKPEVTGQTLIDDLNNQLTDFEQWRGDLDRLAGKVPPSLLKHLRELGPDAAEMVHLISNMSEPELANYLKLWDKYEGLLQEATKKDMEERLKDWRQHGRDIATAIINGLLDEDKQLRAFFFNLFKSLLEESDGGVSGGGGGSSKPAPGTPGATGGAAGVGGTGKNTVGVFPKGVTIFDFKAKGGPLLPMTPTVVGERGPEVVLSRRGGRVVPNSALGGATVHMTVNAVHDESLLTTLNRAAFRLRNRR